MPNFLYGLLLRNIFFRQKSKRDANDWWIFKKKCGTSVLPQSGKFSKDGP